MRFYIFIGVNLWHFPIRSFIFVLIFSFRKSVKIALAYLEKMHSGEECISVRLGLSLKTSQICNDGDPMVSFQHGKVPNRLIQMFSFVVVSVEYFHGKPVYWCFVIEIRLMLSWRR